MADSETIEQRFTIPARCGLAVPLKAGKRLRVINSSGTQVVDTWAFPAADLEAFLSMEHCREVLQRIVFEPGDTLIDNRYRPLLKITADTSPGGHDTLIAACSQAMYAHAGVEGPHANCADNLAAALAGHDRPFAFTPSPWNLFMLAPVNGRPDHRVRPADIQARRLCGGPGRSGLPHGLFRLPGRRLSHEWG